MLPDWDGGIRWQWPVGSRIKLKCKGCNRRESGNGIECVITAGDLYTSLLAALVLGVRCSLSFTFLSKKHLHFFDICLR